MSAYLFENGSILTMVEGAAAPECTLVVDDRIAFVGGVDAARTYISDKALHVETIDLNGRALLPGFIDAHLHPLPMVFFALSADLEGVTALQEVNAALLKQAEIAEPGEWIIGVQFEPKTLAAGEALQLRELDALFPDRAVLIYARDGHCVITNTKALELAGVTAETENPDGGEIGRYSDGSLNGVFMEKAVGLPLTAMPPPSPARMMAASQDCFNTLAQNGITSIGAMLQSDEEGPGGASAQMESMIIQAVREQIPQSVYAIIIGKTLAGVNALINSSLNSADHHTRTRAFKIFADGTFGSCTACMSEPYADKTCTHGYMTLSDDEIYSRMEAAHLAGYQVCIHAIGDQGIANCVDLFERLLTAHPLPSHRHRIEHASIASKALIARIARLGLQICTQPLFIRSEKAWLPMRLGPERSGLAYPLADFFAAGIAVAGSSDAPIEHPDILASIDYAVNRGGFHPEQGVTVEQALAMFTRNAAFVQFEEADKGTIEPGKLADLVILAHDPLQMPPADLGKNTVQQTMIRGEFIAG